MHISFHFNDLSFLYSNVDSGSQLAKCVPHGKQDTLASISEGILLPSIIRNIRTALIKEPVS